MNKISGEEKMEFTFSQALECKLQSKNNFKFFCLYYIAHSDKKFLTNAIFSVDLNYFLLE